MGVIYADAKNLFERFRKESAGKRVVTLGRLAVYLHRSEIAHLKELFSGDSIALEYLASYQWAEYSERFFKDLFKCAVVDSLDFSDYQGATIIHDLQTPIPDALSAKYDLVFDGGTLEHVFNLPAALTNLIRLARTDGLIYVNSPSNNLSGHGFYQFSPELMFRVMSRDNGMALILVRIGVARFPSIEKSPDHPVYDVVDPDSVHCRVGLLSSQPVYLMVMGRKTTECDLFARPVLQSDYSRKWREDAAAPQPRRWRQRILGRLPVMLRVLVLGYRETRIFSLSNARFYRRVW